MSYRTYKRIDKIIQATTLDLETVVDKLLDTNKVIHVHNRKIMKDAIINCYNKYKNANCTKEYMTLDKEIDDFIIQKRTRALELFIQEPSSQPSSQLNNGSLKSLTGCVDIDYENKINQLKQTTYDSFHVRGTKNL